MKNFSGNKFCNFHTPVIVINGNRSNFCTSSTTGEFLVYKRLCKNVWLLVASAYQ